MIFAFKLMDFTWILDFTDGDGVDLAILTANPFPVIQMESFPRRFVGSSIENCRNDVELPVRNSDFQQAHRTACEIVRDNGRVGIVRLTVINEILR